MSEVSMLQANSKNMPFNTGVYPNSENISPPVKKERTRVIEPSTRADINMNALRDWHEKKTYWARMYQDLRLQEYLNQQYLLHDMNQKNIDITVK